jgi:GntR family transcriptional regulator
MAIWFDIDAGSGVPIFKQIIEQVRQAIATGVMQPDERLPTVREMAEEHSVNPNTVAKAYRDLELMGLVYTKPGVRGGTFIAHGQVANLREVAMERFDDSLKKLIRDGHLLGLDAAELTRRFQKEVGEWYMAHPLPEPARIDINFAPGATDLRNRSAERLYKSQE